MRPGSLTLPVFGFLCLIGACQPSDEKKGTPKTLDEHIVHLIPSEDTLLLDLEPFLENTKVIQLDNDPDALTGNIDPVSIRKGSIVIGQRGRPLMYFKEEQGDFIGEIGSLGNAPGEYQSINNISLHPSGNILAIQPRPFTNPILIYELGTDQIRMVKEIVNPVGWKHEGVLWTRNGQLLIRYISANEDRTQVVKQDLDRGMIDSLFRNERKGVFGSVNFDRFNDQVILKSKQVDTLYRVDENDLSIETYMVLDRGFTNMDSLDFVSLQESDPGNLSDYMKAYPDYQILAQFDSGFLLYNRMIDFKGSGENMSVTVYKYWYFVNSDDGELMKVNRVRIRPFPELSPMTIHIDKVKFDSWGHLIIQLEVLEVEEALGNENNFKEIIQTYLFDQDSYEINSNSFLYVGDVKPF